MFLVELATNYPNIHIFGITVEALISIIGLILLFSILITEKIDKTIVSILIAGLLVFFQVFVDRSGNYSSQYIAAEYIYKNLDIFAFIIGMMIIAGITKDSGVFNYIALSLVKKVKGHPVMLFLIFSYMAFFLTVFISNIPTILILAPIVILTTKILDLPAIPYIIGIITFANLGGAVTPISDPTTYYQTITLGFTFWQVFSNTGFIMFIVSIISAIYLYLFFRKDFKIKPNLVGLDKINPANYIKKKKEVVLSVSVLLIVIFFVVTKEFIKNITGIQLDNGSIALFGAFTLILLLGHNVHNILRSQVDYATLFFFAGLFIVVGALEHNGVIDMIADGLTTITNNNKIGLLSIITMGSAMLSVFIDNVPYNIAMVSTLQHFLNNGVITGSAWMALAWGLNSCTSIGGAGSPIGAACNVIALGQAERNGIIISFAKYLMVAVPLVLINSFSAFLILYFRYLF